MNIRPNNMEPSMDPKLISKKYSSVGKIKQTFEHQIKRTKLILNKFETNLNFCCCGFFFILEQKLCKNTV